MEEHRGEGGRFSPEHTDAEILAAVRAHEPAATSEVASEVGMTRQGVDRRLRRLRDSGRVNSKKIGASLVWFAPDDDATETSKPSAPPTNDMTRPGEMDVTGEGSGGGGDEEVVTPATPDVEESADALVEDVRASLAGRPPRTEHGQDAVVDVFRLLRERGTMKTKELKAALYPDYADHYGSERAMWESIARHLEDVPGVEKGGYGEWTYAGDEAARGEVDGAGASEGGVYDPTEEFES